MNPSLSFSIFNVKLTFSFWFFAIIAALALLEREVLALYIALPVFIHEGGHLLAATLCGMRVRELCFTPVSIRIRADGKRLSYSRDLIVALAGAAANLLAALILRLFFFQSMRVMMMMAANLVVGLFNLLPIGSLDGGQVVMQLCSRWFSPQAARAISRTAGFLILTPLTAAAVLMVLSGKMNFTLLLTCAYLMAVIIIRE